MSNAIVPYAATGFSRPYLGVASWIIPGLSSQIPGVSPFANRAITLNLNAAQSDMRRMFGSPSHEPSVVLPFQQNRVVTVAPIAAAPVKEKTAQVAAKTVTPEAKKTLWQTVTQPKVLIAAATVLTVAGGAAAYYFFPVATMAHAVTAGHAGRAVAMNTQQLLIRPGFANSLFLADLVLKAAIVPAAKITLPILLPVISTAIVTTLGTIILLYVANQAWKAAKYAIWGAGSAVVNRLGHECDQTYLGMGVKAIVTTTVSPLISPFMTAEQPVIAPKPDAVSTAQDLELAEESDEEVQPRRLKIEDSSEPKVQEIDDAEAARFEATRAAKNKKAREFLAAKQAQKAQMKAQSTWMGSFIKAGLVTAGLGAGAYFFIKAKPDFDFISTEL
jgi:hypothetical protein